MAATSAGATRGMSVINRSTMPPRVSPTGGHRGATIQVPRLFVLWSGPVLGSVVLGSAVLPSGHDHRLERLLPLHGDQRVVGLLEPESVGYELIDRHAAHQVQPLEEVL